MPLGRCAVKNPDIRYQGPRYQISRAQVSDIKGPDIRYQGPRYQISRATGFSVAGTDCAGTSVLSSKTCTANCASGYSGTSTSRNLKPAHLHAGRGQ
eukprot:gene5371-2429_t